MDDFIDVKIDIFEHTAQRARLRKTITAGALVDEILKEFDDISADSPGKYALFLKGTERPLNPGQTIEQLDLQPQDELVFNYYQQSVRQMLDPKNYAVLKDEATNRLYEIQWQPALIGRPTNEPDHNIRLAVNLQLHPKGQTISRRHAQINFSGGRFSLEPLAENNPVFVNGREVPFGTRKEISPGDRLTLGRSDLVMTFNLQRQEQSAPVAERQREPLPIQDSRPVGDRARSIPEPALVAKVLLVVERATDSARIGQAIDIGTFPYLLGRDIPMLTGESDISRRHAEINYDRNSRKYFITDVRSTNGVTIQGVRIETNRPYEIVAGMRIGLGQNFLLRVEL